MSSARRNDPTSSRRDFGSQVLGLAAGIGAIEAQEKNAAKVETRQPADALADFVRLHSGQHLSEEQWTAVRKKIAANLLSAGVMAKFKLTNADEPIFVFRLDAPP